MISAQTVTVPDMHAAVLRQEGSNEICLQPFCPAACNCDVSGRATTTGCPYTKGNNGRRTLKPGMQISIPLYVVTPFKGLCHLPLHSPLSMLRVALVVSHPLVSLSCANPTRDSRRDSIYVPYGGPRPCFCCSRSRVLLHVSRYDPLCMEGKFGRPEPIKISGKKISV